MTIEFPDPTILHDPTYLLKAELYTNNTTRKSRFYQLTPIEVAPGVQLNEIASLDYPVIFQRFYATYHQAKQASLY